MPPARTPLTGQAWVSARKASDFSQFQPFLQAWVDLNREKAAAIDPSRPAYDVLLDDYEKGMTSARLDAIFTEVRRGVAVLC
jgi:carboxypeptidase Taq